MSRWPTFTICLKHQSLRHCQIPHEVLLVGISTTIAVTQKLAPVAFFADSKIGPRPASRRVLRVANEMGRSGKQALRDERGEAGFANTKSKRRSAPDRETLVSKKLSWLLRHGAVKEGLQINDGGWLNVQDVVRLFDSPTTMLCSVLEPPLCPALAGLFVRELPFLVLYALPVVVRVYRVK